ncbi:MAG: hypothetical protein AVDCRST_MAG20-1786 [uncultured Acidimicrobiales bacterium]|uniref:Uncharacterized protein n=1 Tax=uncultured Acidimicrobiales bacterium TaxID=310071 RepID=A0A6J4I5L4_9ACTN|nr:MAG: hypothetical protein AVDCRST_MAG20-1786 [uncultured Acidimicrobiales bacterium]
MSDASDGDHGNEVPAPAGGGDERTHDPETVPLDLDEGEDVVIRQQAAGEELVVGGGEFPDPDTPPQDPAPGG